MVPPPRKRKPQPPRKSGTAIRFKPEIHEALTTAAAERDLSVNYLVNRAVEDFLRRLIPAGVTVEEMEQCARCGSSMHAEPCQFCPADGWYNEPDPQCPTCDGTGTTWWCLSSEEFCEGNPLPGRDELARLRPRRAVIDDGAPLGTFEPRPAWFDAALCAPDDGQVDPAVVAMFFPTSSDFTDHNRRGVDEIADYELDAKALCSACPVRSDCLLYGLNEPSGIWGGRTARERRFIRRRLRGAAS